MADIDVHASSQATADLQGHGSGGDGGDDNNKRLQKHGKAHYSSAEDEAVWAKIFNFLAGSAGMRHRHKRCIRCGREVGEHHRENWQVQKCTCVLCGNERDSGHLGKVCPVMEENPEFFNKAWVKGALKGYPGVRKGELPPPLTQQQFKSRRDASFRELTTKKDAEPQEDVGQAEVVQQRPLPTFNPASMVQPMMNPMMAMGMMGMGMAMGMVGMSTMTGMTYPMSSTPTAFGFGAAPAASQQQQGDTSGGRGGRGGRGGGRGGRGGGRGGRGGGRGGRGGGLGGQPDPLVIAIRARARNTPGDGADPMDTSETSGDTNNPQNNNIDRGDGTGGGGSGTT
ncbi:hypothetical protein N0V94_005389 [Neodidymelliopsis sp. IMI 364377]|nr:hypothetical protein N0V94_005389 [Neodidymelliopsis sp. IMI 364377]